MAKKKKRPIFAVCLISVLIVAGVLYYLVGPQSEFAHNRRFANGVKEYNYQAAGKAKSEYGELTESMKSALDENLNEYIELCYSEKYEDTSFAKYRGLEIFTEYIQENLEAKMSETVNGFYSGEIDETTAKTLISRLGKFDFASKKLTDCARAIREKKTSDASYEEGLELYYSGKYDSAKEKFACVSEFDKEKYASAQSFSQSCDNFLAQSEENKITD